MDEKKAREELRKRNVGQATGRIGGRGHRPKEGLVDVVNQADAVLERHVYLISTTSDGQEVLWEADLLGDPTPETDGYPPMIHIYCPFCSRPIDPRAISIDWHNKRYAIEALDPPEVLKNVRLIDGRNGPFALHEHLHVYEVIQCPFYEEVEGAICGAKFVIRASRIQRIG